MNKENQLANRANANDSLTISERPEWKKRLHALVVLANQATGRDLMPGEMRLWEVCLREKSIQEIESGFREFFSEPHEEVYFPKPGQILARIEKLSQQRGLEKQWAQTDRECRENQQARATGETVSPGEIWAMAKKWVIEHAMPITPASGAATDQEYAPIVISEQRRNELRKQAEEMRRKYSSEKARQ